jgi:hypothetical protein
MLADAGKNNRSVVPPSPGVPVPGFEALSMSSVLDQGMNACKSRRKRQGNARTGAGVKKQIKKKSEGKIAKFMDAALHEKVGTGAPGLQKPFRFMDLPGGKSLSF